MGDPHDVHRTDREFFGMSGLHPPPKTFAQRFGDELRRLIREGDIKVGEAFTIIPGQPTPAVLRSKENEEMDIGYYDREIARLQTLRDRALALPNFDEAAHEDCFLVRLTREYGDPRKLTYVLLAIDTTHTERSPYNRASATIVHEIMWYFTGRIEDRKSGYMTPNQVRAWLGDRRWTDVEIIPLHRPGDCPRVLDVEETVGQYARRISGARDDGDYTSPGLEGAVDDIARTQLRTSRVVHLEGAVDDGGDRS